MKRLKTFLLALAAMLLAVPSTFAQNMVGRVLTPDEIEDGVEVVFEARSGTTSKGHYLVPFTYGKTNSCQTISSILEVPDEIIWVLERAQVDNAVTGLPQYYIKNKKTGKYLNFKWDTNNSALYPNAFDDPEVWINKYTNGESALVDDTTQAKAFCIVSNSDEEHKSQYGSNSYGSSQSDWEPTTYTVVNIFDATGKTNMQSDGGGYGRVFLANEFEVSKFNITWFSQYQDTNVWDIRRVSDRSASPKDAIEDLLDNFGATIESDYRVGTDPGFVNEDVYNEFYETYQNVLSDYGTMSDAQLKEAFDNLYAAKQKVDAPEAKVQIEDGGYYYIKTACTAFTDVDNGNFAWVAPYSSNICGWKALKANDNQFIWQITKFPDESASNTSGRMYYAFRNVGSNVYLGKAESHSDSQPVNYTKEKEERIFAGDLGGGQFNIGSKYDYYDAYPPRPYHMENHQDGNGTAGKLVLWDGGLGTASAWYIRRVPQEEIDHIADANRVAVDSLRMAILEYDGITSGAEVGEGIGFAHSQELIDNVDTALSKAKAIVAAEEFPAAEEVDAVRKALVEAGNKFNNEVNVVPDGYYIIRSNMEDYVKNENYIYLTLYNDTTPGWTHREKTSAQLWKVTKLAEGGYALQNVKNKMYMNKAEKSSNGSLVNMTKELETPAQFKAIKANGKWGVFNSVDTDFGYDPNGHGNCLFDEGKLQIWSPRQENGGTSWTLISVSEEEVNNVVASEEQNELNINLKKKFEEARRLYNAATNYIVGEPIIKDVSQIYANNWSPNEGAHLENMIDGDKNTYWNSTWEGGQEQTPGEPHSLRIYSEAGFPDTVQVSYVMRQDNSWHRVPARMRIQVSNDAESWTTLPNDMTLADFGGQSFLSTLHNDSLTYIVNGIGGYKYVRFQTLVSINNGGGVYFANNHAVFGYAEYNLYPITGVDENSSILKPSHKGVAFELFNAIQAAKDEYNNGNATQANYDKLVAALEAFKNLSNNDSTIAMARYNVDNLTEGDRIGEFPAAALQTYSSKATALLAEYDGAESALSSAKIKEIVGGLKDAYATLYDNMVKPADKMWYVINTADDARPGKSLTAGGSHTHAAGEGYSYFLTKEYSADGYYESWFHWTLTKDENGRFVPQNVGNGGFFGPYTGSGKADYDYRPISWYTPKSFTIVPFGDGQVGFLTAEGYYVKNNAAWFADGMTYTKADDSAPSFKNTSFAWTVEASEENHSDFAVEEYADFENGRVIAITIPYEYEVPATYGNDEVTPYDIVGKVTTDEGDSIVTAYKLKHVSTETVKGGKPVVYIMPGEYNASEKSALSFNPVMNGSVSAEKDTVNGLISVPATWTTTVDHYGYFLADSVVDEPKNTTIGYKRGVILPRLVQNTVSDDEVDAIVYVKGAGMLNGIKNAEILAIKQFVNVYTTDGVLVRKHVDAANATAGLKKGVYVVGNKKVLVK